MDKKELASEWFLFAKKDLDSARYLKGMKPAPLEIICYHCQQSTEKYLKGFIFMHGGEIQKTHDLVLLLKKCIEFDDSFKNLTTECIRLTNYGIQPRYPFEMEIIDRDMILAIESAETVQHFVLEIGN